MSLLPQVFFESAYVSQDIVDQLRSLPGVKLHSTEYRSAEIVRDKRVVIAGGSMSAVEIAPDMASAANTYCSCCFTQFLVNTSASTLETR